MSCAAVQPLHSCPAGARGQISTEYAAKICSAHPQTSLSFLQGTHHRKLVLSETYYCTSQKTGPCLTAMWLFYAAFQQVTCKVNRKHCQSIRLLRVAPYLCQGHSSLSVRDSRQPPQHWPLPSCLSKALRRCRQKHYPHDGNIMSPKPINSHSHFMLQRMSLIVHLWGATLWDPYEKRVRPALLNNTKILSIKRERDYSTCALSIFEDKLNLTCKDSKNCTQLFLLFLF